MLTMLLFPLGIAAAVVVLIYGIIWLLNNIPGPTSKPSETDPS